MIEISNKFKITILPYSEKLRVLQFVQKVAGFEEYLCSKFEKGLNFEIWKKISIFESQNYKEVVQLALRVEKLVNERVTKGKF